MTLKETSSNEKSHIDSNRPLHICCMNESSAIIVIRPYDSHETMYANYFVEILITWRITIDQKIRKRRFQTAELSSHTGMNFETKPVELRTLYAIQMTFQEIVS